MKRSLFFFSFVLLLLAALTYLFVSPKATRAKESRKCLHLCFSRDPTTLDPRKSGDFISSSLLFFLYCGLTEQQPDGTTSLALAESCSISADGRRYLFTLRDCYWPDGHAIIAKDFELTWKSLLTPGFPSLCPHLFSPIKNAQAAWKGEVSLDEVGIQALNAKTLLVELEYPIPYFLSLLSFSSFFPLPSHLEESKDASTPLISNGPYQLKKWSHNNELILKKNPFFWKAREVSLKKIRISIVPNANTALQMYENNELDLLGTPLAPLPLECLPSLQAHKELECRPMAGTTFCAFNTHRFPFTNRKVRIAFSAAIDREALVQHITQMKESIALRCLTPFLLKESQVSENRAVFRRSFARHSSIYRTEGKARKPLKRNPWEIQFNGQNGLGQRFLKGEIRPFLENNNPLLANEYLEEGLKELNTEKESLEVVLSFGPTQLEKKIAEFLQDQWQKNLSVKVRLEQNESKIFNDKLYKRTFQLALSRWVLQYMDPMNIFERFQSSEQPKNYPGWEDEHFTAELQQIKEMQDPMERGQAIEALEQYFLDQMPITPLYHHTYSILVKPYVQNLQVGPFGDLYPFQVYMEKRK